MTKTKDVTTVRENGQERKIGISKSLIGTEVIENEAMRESEDVTTETIAISTTTEMTGAWTATTVTGADGTRIETIEIGTTERDQGRGLTKRIMEGKRENKKDD